MYILVFSPSIFDISGRRLGVFDYASLWDYTSRITIHVFQEPTACVLDWTTRRPRTQKNNVLRSIDGLGEKGWPAQFSEAKVGLAWSQPSFSWAKDGSGLVSRSEVNEQPIIS